MSLLSMRYEPLNRWLLKSALGRKVAILMFCATFLGLLTFPQGTSAPASKDQSDLFDRVIANQKRTESALDVYERIERVEIRKSGSDANPFEVKAWRVFPAGTGMDKISLGPGDKPANLENYRAELEKLEKQLVWAAQRGPAQQEAYAKLERKRKERNELLNSTHDAFLFALVGHEVRGDRSLAKYTMSPNPKYKPTNRNTTLFTKVSGTLWIDVQSSELAKIEGHVTEDISLALFVAKVYKGSYFMQERYEIAPGIWLPTFQQYDFDGRKFLLPFSIHERSFYTSYRRVGPPKEAREIVLSELSKGAGERADP